MGTRTGRNRRQNLLPFPIPEREARRIVKAFRVPSEKGGGRKPADNDFAGKTPHRPTKPDFCRFIGKTRIYPDDSMELGISAES